MDIPAEPRFAIEMKNFFVFKYTIILAMALFINKSAAQDTLGITPMHLFLKKNTDSTLILEYNHSFLHTPEYFILGKKGDTISTFTYKVQSNIDSRIILPHNIGYKIFKRDKLNIYSVPVDINMFFNAKYLSPDSLDKFWKSIQAVKPWQIRDDHIDGKGCPVYTAEKYVSDLGGVSLFLITKNEIKRLYFYGPWYFEEKVCPTRPGRKAILKITGLFSTYFKE